MMRLASATAALAVLALPVATVAARPRPTLLALQDRAPTSTTFADRVITGRAGARAAAAATAGTTASYDTGDGTRVRITVDAAFAGDTSRAQSYATFLGTLPHGAELAKLRVRIVPAANVAGDCGAAGQDVLACYVDTTRTMIVPGDAESSSGGVTTSFVIAHEYGHHVAAYRSDAPFSALDFGPKRWASYERVCARTLAGRLAPGDEGAGYASNPGEGWAETYAHLVYPDVEWDYTKLLEPTAGSLKAARADVLDPWTGGRTRRFAGTFARGRAGASRRFTVKLSLDGAVAVRLRGPKGAQYDVRLVSAGHTLAAGKAAGSGDRLSLRAACRSTSGTQPLTVAVVRRSGHGAFRLRVSYAG
jgi:hypothetical protein